MLRFINITLLTLTFIMTTTLLPDSISLKNGQRLEGLIINENPSSIRVNFNGRLQVIPKSEIAEIRLDSNRSPGPQTTPVRNYYGKINPTVRKPSPTPKPDTRLKKSIYSDSLNAGWRSALLPGWGHFWAGQKFTGITYGLVFLGAASNLQNALSNASSARSAYNNTSLQSSLLVSQLSLLPAGTGSATLLSMALDQAARSHYELQVRKANDAYSILGVIYLAQLIHSYFSAVKKPNPTRLNAGTKSSGINFYATPYLTNVNDTGLGMGLQFKF